MLAGGSNGTFLPSRDGQEFRVTQLLPAGHQRPDKADREDRPSANDLLGDIVPTLKHALSHARNRPLGAGQRQEPQRDVVTGKICLRTEATGLFETSTS